MSLHVTRCTTFLRSALVFPLIAAMSGAIAGGQFSPTGDMVSPRILNGTAALDDGRVLLVGGLADFGVVLDSAELYDPATGTFSATGSISEKRGGPVTVRLADGRVLVAGGRGGTEGDTIFSLAEIYDPATGLFTKTGEMTTPRYVASGTLLGDGTVLVVGGTAGRDVLDSAELYDPVSGTFSSTGPLGAPRVSPTGAVRLADGRVLIVGGSNETGALATAEIYDPATGTFSATGSLPEGRLDPSLVLLADGRVLAAGGTDGNNNYYATAQIYDPATGVFTATGDLAFPREQQTGTLLPDGRVLIAGGAKLPGSAEEIYTTTAEIYDASTGAFTASGSMISGRYAASATALPGGRVLIAGGWGGDQILPIDKAELFTPDLPDEIFADGFDGEPVEPVVSTYDDLTEGFLGTSFDYNGVSYHDVNGIGGVFPDGSTFVPDDVGDQVIIEQANVFYEQFPDWGSSPNTMTFGTSFVNGPNLSIGALVRATMDLDTPANAASVEIAFYENGPWGGIVIHLDALDGDTVVDSDTLTIANGGGRDNATTATLSVNAASFGTLKLYATYGAEPSAPRIMIDNLALTPAAAR
jgi:hypothetical protein